MYAFSFNTNVSEGLTNSYKKKKLHTHFVEDGWMDGRIDEAKEQQLYT